MMLAKRGFSHEVFHMTNNKSFFLEFSPVVLVRIIIRCDNDFVGEFPTCQALLCFLTINN